MSITAEQYLIVLLSIVIGEYILTTTIDLLNLAKDSGTVPENLKSVLNDKKYKKALSYQKENSYFGLASGLFSLLLLMLVLIFGLFGELDQYVSQYFESTLGQTLVFFGIIFLLNDIINIPFQLYATFKIEEKYGFNTTSIKTFVTDKLKSYAFTILIGGILLSIFILLIVYLGKDFWWIFWLVASLFMVVMNFFYTSWIVPIFNKLSPLEEGELKEAILSYAESVDFPIKNVYVIDGSRRSKKANAYFSGFGKNKKIVLFDTLVENYSREELVAILAHEVGHYKKKHTISGMLSSVFQVGIMLFVMSRMIFDPSLSEALGAESLSFAVNVIAFGIIYTPVSLITGIIGNYISRKHEFEADNYAKTTYKGEALASGLKKLSADSLSNLRPHSWYVFLHYSHPPLLKRLAAIER